MLARTGSVRRGAVSIDLAEERQKCSFDQKEMGVFLGGGQERYDFWKESLDKFGNDPELRNSFEYEQMTRVEMMEDLWRRMKVVMEKHGKAFFETD